MGFTIGYLRC